MPEAAVHSGDTKMIRQDCCPDLQGRQRDEQNTLQVKGICPSQGEPFQDTKRRNNDLSVENSRSGKTPRDSYVHIGF